MADAGLEGQGLGEEERDRMVSSKCRGLRWRLERDRVLHSLIDCRRDCLVWLEMHNAKTS